MDRIEKLMQSIPADLDGVFITSSVNRLYYTNLRSSAGILLATREKAYFLIDFRYIEIARRTIKNCEVMLLEGNGKAQLQKIIEKHGLKKIGIESSYLSVESYLSYKELLAPAELSFDNRVSEVITRQRMIKTPDEVKAIQVCQDLTDDTFAHILNFIKEGRTELEVALEMEFYMRKKGAQEVSFSFIVVSGANSSLPHGVPGNKKIEKGDFVTMDFGAAIGGYRSDMTRTVAVGFATEEMEKIYNTVLQAQLAGIAATKAGVPGKDIDAAARKVITDAGYGEYFGHGYGHSLGLEIHESPNPNARNAEGIPAGAVCSAEPGIYLPGKFGVRIEDVTIVTEDGCIDITGSPKNLMIV